MTTETWVERLLGGVGGPRGSTLTYFGSAATLKPLNETNIGMLKVYLEQQESRYSESHYTRVEESCGYSLIALSAGRPVGCICCSLEEDSAAAALTPFTPLQTIWRQSQGKTETQPQKKLVKIMLLQVSAEDRCRGIGSNMLRCVIRAAKADSQISRLALDVHAENEGAIRLYRRLGFRITGSKQNHSKSWIMELPIGDPVDENVEKSSSSFSSSSSSLGKEEASTAKSMQPKKEIQEEDIAKLWRRRLVADAAAEKWNNQMEAEKGRGAEIEGVLGTSGLLKETYKRRGSDGIERRGSKDTAKGLNDTGNSKEIVSQLRRSPIQIEKEASQRVSSGRSISGANEGDSGDLGSSDVDKRSTELLDKITRRAKERAEKMARILQRMPPTGSESRVDRVGTRVGTGSRVGTGVGTGNGVGSQPTNFSLVNHEEVMLRLRRKASELPTGGRTSSNNPSHRWTVYSVSNWRQA